MQVPFTAGMNTPDHEAMFQRLTEELVSKVSPFVVRLNSRKCANGERVHLSAYVEHVARQMLAPLLTQ